MMCSRSVFIMVQRHWYHFIAREILYQRIGRANQNTWGIMIHKTIPQKNYENIDIILIYKYVTYNKMVEVKMKKFCQIKILSQLRSFQ